VSTAGTTSKVKAAPKMTAVFERFVIVVLLAGSIALAWWSTERLTRVQKESAEINHRISRLGTDVDLMRGAWSDEKLAGLSNRLGEAHGLLFQGGPAVIQWRDDLIRQVVPLALDARVMFQGTRTQTVGDRVLTLVRASVDVTPSTEVAATRSAYERVLDLSHRLANHPRRVDFVKLIVQGASNSVGQATAVVDLWATEEDLAGP
jgi:hypothetical protein